MAESFGNSARAHTFDRIAAHNWCGVENFAMSMSEDWEQTCMIASMNCGIFNHHISICVERRCYAHNRTNWTTILHLRTSKRIALVCDSLLNTWCATTLTMILAQRMRMFKWKENQFPWPNARIWLIGHNLSTPQYYATILLIYDIRYE